MKKIKSFPKKPKLVQSPDNIIWGFKEEPCDCNICRLSRYKDHTAYYAYLVAEANNLNALIEILKEEGWKNYGLSDTKHKKNLAVFECNLADTCSLLCELSKKTKVILKDYNNEEIK